MKRRRVALVVIGLVSLGCVGACSTILQIDDDPPSSVAADSATVDAGLPLDAPLLEGSTTDGGGDATMLHKRVFVTGPTFGGYLFQTVIDAGICQSLADEKLLDGSFEPWLYYSDASPLGRVGDGPWYALDRTTFIASKADLTGEAGAPITMLEDGGSITPAFGNQFAWTGTNGNGTRGYNCGEWRGLGVGVEATAGAAGQLGSQGGAWTNLSSPGCDQQHHIYCFEK